MDDTTREQAEAHARQQARQAPPLTPQQRERVVALLHAGNPAANAA